MLTLVLLVFDEHINLTHINWTTNAGCEKMHKWHKD